jgi:hypothetical protein
MSKVRSLANFVEALWIEPKQRGEARCLEKSYYFMAAYPMTEYGPTARQDRHAQRQRTASDDNVQDQLKRMKKPE